MLLLLLSCSRPECEAGMKFNTDGLCVEDTGVVETDTDTDSDSDSDTDSDTDTDSDSDTDSGDSGDTAVASDWETLGGESAVNTLLDAFIAKVAADNTVNWMFANTDLAAFKVSLHDLISSATGGPVSYTGPDMLTAHKNMAITDDQWNSLVGDLVAAMDEVGVPHSADFSGQEPADRLVTALGGMHNDIVTDPTGTTVLFNQLGGHPAVEGLIYQFTLEVGADDRINGYFASTDMSKFGTLLVKQVCAATGGYCVYDGKSMLDAHTGMGVTEEDFTAVVEDMMAALDTQRIPYTEPDFSGSYPADSLMLALAAMHDDIVGH